MLGFSIAKPKPFVSVRIYYLHPDIVRNDKDAPYFYTYQSYRVSFERICPALFSFDGKGDIESDIF